MGPFTALSQGIYVCTEPSAREREKEKRNDRREENIQTTSIRCGWRLFGYFPLCKHSRSLIYNHS